MVAVSGVTLIKTPTRFYLVSGACDAFSPLNAFDGALLMSGVGDTNLVRMSSILPPGCVEFDPKPKALPMGALVPVAYASIMSSTYGEIISSAVAIGVPEDDSLAGLIMEYSAKDTEYNVKNQVIRMVQRGMAMRERRIKEIKSISATHRVIDNGATFAGVILWN